MVKIYLTLAPAYRHIINPTNPITSTLPKSGISKKTINKSPLSRRKAVKNSSVFTFLFFLMSQLERKNTYPSLKNSAGCIVVRPPIFIHPLAPLNVAPIGSGKNTASCNKKIPINHNIIFLLFSRYLIGIL